MPEPIWWTYFKTVAGTEDGATIAGAAEVTASQVSRWKSGKNRPDADKVVTFARNHSKSPIEALIACGFIRKDEVGGVVEIRTSTTTLSNQELIDEISDRLNRAAQQQRQSGQKWNVTRSPASRKPPVDLTNVAASVGEKAAEGRAAADDDAFILEQADEADRKRHQQEADHGSIDS